MLDLSQIVYYAGGFYVILPILVILGFAIYYMAGNKLPQELLDRWIDISKWYMGSVAIVFATSLVTNAFTERETGIKEMQLYDSYVQYILEENNIYKRKKLAQYFATVTPTERLRTRWEAYEQKLESEEKEYEELLAEIERKRNDSSLVQDSKTFDLLTKQRAAYEEPLKSSSASVSRVDIFYLEGSETAEKHAEELKQLLENTRYEVKVKLLSTAINSRKGMQINVNQIRSEADELGEASELKAFLGEDLVIKRINYQTPGYLSIFLVD